MLRARLAVAIWDNSRSRSFATVVTLSALLVDGGLQLLLALSRNRLQPARGSKGGAGDRGSLQPTWYIYDVFFVNL